MQEIAKLECDLVVSLGDVAGYYCMLNECIELLRKNRILNIQGNHDAYLAFDRKCPRSTSANVCLEYQQKKITPENKLWLQESKPGPFTMSFQFGQISLVHGGWNDPIEEYMYQLSESYFRSREDSYFFSGHTHVQTQVKLGEKVYCNPGSVGQPRDGDPRAAFAVLSSNGAIDLHRIEYDIQAMANAMEKAGFDEKIYENLFSGTRIGGKISKITIV